MSCLYKIGTMEFSSIEEVKAYISSNGLGGLSTEGLPSQAATIIAKYDFSTYTESVAEMIARLNYKRMTGKNPETLTPEEINNLIYPPGKLTDYVTQSIIHRNTYAGLRITGISANSGKMGGYMFESTPVKTVIDTKTNEVFSPTQANLRAYKVSSVNELLDRHPYVKVKEREIPTLKENSYVTVNDVTYTQLSRLEHNTNTNIFELVDMIINLAIDNVKEQKLFVFGITNSNANAFLSALFLGIPLLDIVRMFTTPAVATLSTKRFLSKSNYTEAAQDVLSQFDTEKASKALNEYFNGNIPTKIQTQLAKHNNSLAAYINVFKGLSPKSSILEDVYTGDASAALKLLSDYVTLNQLSTLATIGEEFFVYSQLFSLLRSLPSSKARIDYLINKVRDYSEFSYLSGTETVISERIVDALRESILQSDLYQNMRDVDPAKAEQLFNEQLTQLKENSLFKNTVATRSRQWFSNRVMRSQATMYLKPTSKSAFTNVTPLAIPHVYQAYKSMLLLNNILESGFFTYSPIVQKTVQSVLKKIGKISDSTPKSAFYFSMLDNTAKELLKFINSTNSVNIDGIDVSFDVATLTDIATVRGISYRGIEGWAQNFIKRIMAERNKYELVQNLEVIVDNNTGLSRLGITADKINDDEIRELLKASYEELFNDNPTLALDLFRYAVMSQGLYYGRTSLGRIFPSRLIVAFSKAMAARITEIKGSSDVEFTANLEAIESQFLHQLIASNPDTLPYVAGQKPLLLSTVARGIHKGMDMVEGKPVYYDLKYKKIAGNNYPKVIKRFGDKIYARLEVPTDSAVYYRVFATSSIHNSYSFYSSDLYNGLNFDKLLDPSANVLYGTTPLNNNTFEYVGNQIAEVGSTVFIPIMKGNLPIALAEVKISSVQPIIRGDITVANRYSFTKQSEVPLLDTEAVTKNRSMVVPIDLASRESAVSVIPITMLSRVKNKVTIASDVSTISPSENVYVLPINALSGAQGDYFKSLLDDTLTLIQKLPLRAKFAVQQSILEPLKIVNPQAARQLAVALFHSTGYVDQMIEENQEFTVTDRLFAELDFMVNKNETLPATSFSIAGETVTINNDLLPFAVKRKMQSGIMLKLGYTTNGTVYAYIRNVEENSSTGTVFGENTLRLINSNILSVDEFENILTKTQPC